MKIDFILEPLSDDFIQITVDEVGFVAFSEVSKCAFLLEDNWELSDATDVGLQELLISFHDLLIIRLQVSDDFFAPDGSLIFLQISQFLDNGGSREIFGGFKLLSRISSQDKDLSKESSLYVSIGIVRSKSKALEDLLSVNELELVGGDINVKNNLGHVMDKESRRTANSVCH